MTGKNYNIALVFIIISCNFTLTYDLGGMKETQFELLTSFLIPFFLVLIINVQ